MVVGLLALVVIPIFERSENAQKGWEQILIIRGAERSTDIGLHKAGWAWGWLIYIFFCIMYTMFLSRQKKHVQDF